MMTTALDIGEVIRMRVYKLVIMVIDHDGVESVKEEIENGRFANRCISPYVISDEWVDIGTWEDDNPLNFGDKILAEFARLFPTPLPPNALNAPLSVAGRLSSISPRRASGLASARVAPQESDPADWSDDVTG